MLGLSSRWAKNVRKLVLPVVPLSAPGDAVALVATRAFAMPSAWEWKRARKTAEELTPSTQGLGFPLFIGVATTFRGHALGDPAEIIDGLRRTAGTGTQCGGPLIFTVLAEAYQRCGQPTEAEPVILRAVCNPTRNAAFHDTPPHRRAKIKRTSGMGS
jgi:hypothetical protein